MILHMPMSCKEWTRTSMWQVGLIVTSVMVGCGKCCRDAHVHC